MRSLTILIALLLLVVPIAMAQTLPDIEVTIQKTEPSPAEPGSYTDVYLLVTNHRGIAKKLEVEYLPEYPFTLASGETAKKNVGDLDSLRETYAIVQYRVNIDPAAQNKDYNFTVYSSTEQKSDRIKWEYSVAVRGTDASITLESYEFNPEEIKPGQTADLTLGLKNTGRTDVKDIDVSLTLSDKISTVGSGNTKRIQRLDAGKTAELTYKLIVDGSAQVKVHDIPVSLEFRDRLNSKYAKTTSLGMLIKAHPELNLRLDDTTIKEQMSPGEISIQVVNSGIVDLRYVNLDLKESDQYDILSYSNDVYIGNLDSDDFEIAQFNIRPMVKEPILNFDVEFKDPYNTDYDQAYDIPLRIISAEDLGESKSNTTLIFVGLALVVAGVVIYLRRKKRRQASLQKTQTHHMPKKKVVKKRRR